MTEKKHIKTDTIVRTIVLVIALTNQILTATGRNPIPIADDDVYTLVTVIATTAAALWTWWKNNSFTQPAIEADELLKKIKEAK